MKRILNMSKENRVSFLIANILLIFFDSITLIFPIIIGYIIDNILINHNMNQILYLTIFMIAFAIFKYAGAYFSVIKLEHICLKIIANVKRKCYQKLNELDYYYFEHNSRGELMTAFTSDLNNIRRQLSYNIKTIGFIVVTFIWSFCYLLTKNALFTLILLTPAIIIGVISYHFLRKIVPKYELVRDKTALCNDYISDNIEGNRVVKTFAIEHEEIKNMKKLANNYINQDIENCLLEDSFFAKIDFFSNFMYVLFLLIGGYLFIHDSITIGTLVIFSSYLSYLITPFTRLSELLGSVERYLVSKKRIFKILDAEPKVILLGTKSIANLNVPITFNGVRVVYDNKVVLNDLNLKINPKETIAFIGPTGSGKSTIAKLLLGLITPESGEILIGKDNFLDLNIKDIREKIGYVSQNPFLFSDTIYNNINYGTNITKEEAYHYASLACCTYIDKLPQKIDTMIGEKGVGLSGGEKQRLSLARALAVNPDILLLDDITSALDIETEEKINESIANLKIKTTKVIIASKIVSVMNADKIVVLDKGVVAEVGTHEELLKKKGLYYELYKIQEGLS